MSVPVLYYHSIDEDSLSVAPAIFGAQMAWLARAGYRCPTASQWLAGETDETRTALITFDDGFDGIARWALPILSRFGFRATVFVPTSYPGRLLWGDAGTRRWSEAAVQDSIRHRIMGWDELVRLSEQGVEVGSHGVTHRNLTELPADAAAEEIAASRLEISRRLGVSVNAFCYPRGGHSQTIEEAVRRAGYRGAFTTRRGFASLDERFALPRLPIGDSVLGLVQQVRGWRVGTPGELVCRCGAVGERWYWRRRLRGTRGR